MLVVMLHSMLHVVCKHFTFHAFGLCSMSCLVSSFMLLGMFHVYSVFHALCFMLRISCSIYSMLEVMLLRVVFYSMLDASYHVSFMPYRVKALTSADSVGMSLQKRSMKADADHGNLILASYHVSFTSYR